MDENVIVMSESGKPIFFRFGSQGTIARICGLVQALRTTQRNLDTKFGFGEIQSIVSGKLYIVFMTVESITLVHVSKQSKSDNANEIDVVGTYSRLQLEYVYSYLIFMFTDVQRIFDNNPGFDLGSVMNSNDRLIKGLLDEIGPKGNFGPFLVSGIQTCFPLSCNMRNVASKTLQSIAGRIENNCAFALLIAGDKLLTVVQPSFRPHQLRVSDLHLILNFINNQPGLLASELWIPMCLPRLNSSGFLYAYTNCFDVASKLSLILISSNNTTEQFQLLRNASKEILEDLGLQSVLSSILEIEDVEPKSTSIMQADVGWKRTVESLDSITTDEGYINVTTDMIRNSKVSSIEEGEFLKQVQQSLYLSSLDHICDRYLDAQHSASLVHFLFRLDVPVVQVSSQMKHRQQKLGFVSQCISPIVPASCGNDISRRRHFYTNYQKLCLRLRLGSASFESSMDAFDMIQNDSSCFDERDMKGIGSTVAATLLLESSPYNKDGGLAYIREGNNIFLAMNGKHFELYIVTLSNISLTTAATIATKLVREFILDKKNLFLTKPLTWLI